MGWKRSPPELIAAFDDALPGPPVERRLMFGYPAGFVNGNMFCGLFQDRVVLKLDEKARDELKGEPFEPMPGRPMKAFAVAPQTVVEDPAELRDWMERALSFVSKLPPKASKKKSPPSKKKSPPPKKQRK